MLKEKILNKESGIITYGLTPPKESYTNKKVQKVAEIQINRIKDLGVDGLVLYDLQDESSRIEVERPFPFLPTLDPSLYSKDYFGGLEIPKIIYRCVGKYSKEDLSNWLNLKEDILSVFVGAASKEQEIKLSLKEAYQIYQKSNKNILLGGVTIPERHTKLNDEHLRLMNKIKQGCNFFISQAVYNLEFSKNFLADYYYYCQNNNLEMPPIIFTLTPCGSKKTLEFIKWLGISLPNWLENDLLNSKDMLHKSVNLLKKIAKELVEYAREKDIPIGFNIESVSIRKVEIEASVELVYDVKKILGNRS